MSFHLLVLLLSLISTIVGRETRNKNDSKMNIIQVEYEADEFDCVDIHKQPAFSHHLLKNHKIQLSPSFSKNSRRNEVNPFNTADIGFKRKGCPLGKVPIQRKKSNTSFDQFSSTYPNQHFATLQYSGSGDIYHGARAWMGVYNPHVVDSQKSAAYIWVQRGGLSDLNSIHIGWAVNPKLYGDTVTRITAYWTKDNYQKTGCYNVQCPGFVQISPRMPLGASVGSTSTYGGVQYEINLMIKQDPASLHWWMVLNDEKVGYWPKEIFSHLQTGATQLQYGGWVFASSNRNSPPMGSGHLPNIDNKKSCVFRQIKFVDSTYQELDILDYKTHVNCDSRCYNIIYWQYRGPFWGKALSFGGPGGQCST